MVDSKEAVLCLSRAREDNLEKGTYMVSLCSFDSSTSSLNSVSFSISVASYLGVHVKLLFLFINRGSVYNK